MIDRFINWLQDFFCEEDEEIFDEYNELDIFGFIAEDGIDDE